jgi:hypothetical protein
MKARKKGGDPKRSPDMEPMKKKSMGAGIASANLKSDKMNAARSAIFTSSSEKEVLDKLEKGFSSIKPDSTLRGGYSDRRLGIIDPRNVDESTERERRIAKLEDADATKKFQATLDKKGNPRKTKARYQDGGKVPKAQKKEDKEVAKSVAGSRYVGTGDKAMNYDANSLKKAQQATDKLVDLDMRAIKKRLSEEEKSSMKSTRDSLRSLINENIVGPDAAVMYGQTKKRWQMKND